MSEKDRHKERWEEAGNDRTDRMEKDHIHQAVCVYQQQICCCSYEDKCSHVDEQSCGSQKPNTKY